jgi:hypothetical protein
MRRDAAAGTLGLVGDRHQDGEVGIADAADPDLAAVDHPVGAVAHRARGHARGIAARTGLGNRDRRGQLTPCIRLQVALLLVLVAGGHQHAQVRAVRRQGIGRDGLALFFLDPDHRHHRQIRSAELRRCVQAPQSELFRLRIDRRAFFRRQRIAAARGLPRQHGVFQRQQLVTDEAGHQVPDHPVFFAELEIHRSCLSTRQYEAYQMGCRWQPASPCDLWSHFLRPLVAPSWTFG